MTAPSQTNATEAPAALYEPPTISANRLVMVGGEKGSPGCERKYFGAKILGMLQSSSAALEFGTALHSVGEHHQLTGEILDPESDVAEVYRAGAHLVTQCGTLLVEHEHVGTLPDGSPYLAYIDGHSPGVGTTGVVVIQDLKTTSNRRYALVGQDPERAPDEPLEDYALELNLQAMFYAWILLCDDGHMYCPPLPDGAYGPKHWRPWSTAGVRAGRLRWIYFLTRGVPTAWDATSWTSPAGAAAFMQKTILPLVERINNMHLWRHRNPTGTLDDIDRNFDACSKQGRWCGVYENNACDFAQLGTPINDLIQLRKRTQMTPAERLAALKANRAAGGAAAITAPAAPAQPEVTALPKAEVAPAVAVATNAPDGQATTASTPATPSAPEASASAVVAPSPSSESSAVSAPSGEPAAAATPKRGRPRRTTPPPAATPGAGINPPEVSEALAKLTAATPVATDAPAAAPAAAALPAANSGVQVTGAANRNDTYPSAVAFDVQDSRLVVRNADGAELAIYAAGFWACARLLSGVTQ